MKILFFILLFLIANPLQAQIIYPYQEPCGVEIRYLPPLYRDLLNQGEVKTRKEVMITVNDSGKQIQVPIINGWAPSIKIMRYFNGAERHVFDYRAHSKWSGATDWSKKDVAQSVDRVVELQTRPASKDLFERSLETFQKDHSNRWDVRPTLSTDESPFLKKPSEISNF